MTDTSETGLMQQSILFYVEWFDPHQRTWNPIGVYGNTVDATSHYKSQINAHPERAWRMYKSERADTMLRMSTPKRG